MSLFENIVKNVLNEATNVKKLYKTFSTVDSDIIDMAVRLCPDTNINTNPNTGEEFVMVNKIGIWLLNQIKNNPDIGEFLESNGEFVNDLKNNLDDYNSLPMDVKVKYNIGNLNNISFAKFEDICESLRENGVFKEAENLRGKTKFENIVNKLKVYEDDKWIVCKVTTYEDDKIIGGGTKWCTASDENGRYNGREMFENYTENGQYPLWVVIRKDGDFRKNKDGEYIDRDCMYQLAFEYDDYGGMFCDAFDGTISLYYKFMDDDKLLEFFKGVLDNKAYEHFNDSTSANEIWCENVRENARTIFYNEDEIIGCQLMQYTEFQPGVEIASPEDCEFYIYQYDPFDELMMSFERFTQNSVIKTWGDSCAILYKGLQDDGNSYAFVYINGPDGGLAVFSYVSRYIEIDEHAILTFHEEYLELLTLYLVESKNMLYISKMNAEDAKVIYSEPPYIYIIQIKNKDDNKYYLYSTIAEDIIIVSGYEFTLKNINGENVIISNNVIYNLNGKIISDNESKLSQPSVAERRNHIGGLLIERIEKLIKELNGDLNYA